MTAWRLQVPHFLRSAFSHQGFRRYFMNTGWMFAEKVLRLIAGLFVGAYVARYLGPAHYGLLNYAVSFVALVAVVATFGLESVVIRELVRGERSRNMLLGTAFSLRALGALGSFILLVVINESVEPDPLTRSLVYIIACGTFFEVFGIIDYFFQSQVGSRYVVWSQMIALACSSVFRIILVIYQADLVWFAWTQVLDFAVMAMGMVFFYQRQHASVFSWRWSGSTAAYLLRHSWLLILSSLAVTIYLRIGQIMIKWMLGEEANGIYGVAVRLSELWNFIPMAICSSVFPAILNAKSISEEIYNQRLQWLYDLMVWMSVGIAIPTTLLSTWVVVLVFGPDYAAAGNILSLYIWSGVFIFLGVANGKWIISENLQRFRMISLIISGVMNIVLNYVLIKAVGINGAAISALITYAFAGYFFLLFHRKTRPMFVIMTRSFNPIRVLKDLKHIRNLKNG